MMGWSVKNQRGGRRGRGEKVEGKNPNRRPIWRSGQSRHRKMVSEVKTNELAEKYWCAKICDAEISHAENFPKYTRSGAMWVLSKKSKINSLFC